MDDARTELDAAITLVDSSVARIRLGGLLRLARLADDVPRLRQGVVTVLGAYLRRPVPAGTGREARSERDVRRAVLGLLRERLQDPAAATTWCGLDVDLRDGVLEGDLSGVVVTAGLRLDRAVVPQGATLDLSGARVRAGALVLDRLTLDGRLDATGLVVESGEASFDRMRLADGAQALLDDARVDGGCLLVRGVDVGAGLLALRRLHVTAGLVSLHEAHVAGGTLALDGLGVDGGGVSLGTTTVETGTLDLTAARVGGGLLTLGLTGVRGGRVSLADAEVGDGGTVRLDGLHVDDATDVAWGPFAAARGADLPTPDLPTPALPTPDLPTPDAAGRQDVPSPPERAAS